MKKIILFLATALSANAFATSPVMTTQKCGSANVEVDAYVFADTLEVKSIKVDSVEVEFIDSNLEANLRGGTVFEVFYCPAGESMSDVNEIEGGGTLIGCNIQRSLIICE